mgnify:CR=1 FL=1
MYTSDPTRPSETDLIGFHAGIDLGVQPGGLIDVEFQARSRSEKCETLALEIVNAVVLTPCQRLAQVGRIGGSNYLGAKVGTKSNLRPTLAPHAVNDVLGPIS